MTILRAALLPLLLLAAAPAAAETCRPAVVRDVAQGAIRIDDGRAFLPHDPEDAAEILPGDVVFACEHHLQETEMLFPIPGSWLPEET